MIDKEYLINLITEEVLRVLEEEPEQAAESREVREADPALPARVRDPGAASYFSVREATDENQQALLDIAANGFKKTIQFVDPENQIALDRLCRDTIARIGIGRCGPRLNTKSVLSLRADHAMAKDAVLSSVDTDLLKDMKLPVAVSRCENIDEHITRPDLGRKLSDKAIADINKYCKKNPDIQVYVSDGLSSAAVENNIRELFPVLMEGLEDAGFVVGTPFFVKFGRVPTMDAISDLVKPKAICVLLGERPGLNAADSMSAYITYNATVGISESKRTVISNIHENGIQPVEAGAYLVEVIEKILTQEKSGIDLKL